MFYVLLFCNTILKRCYTNHYHYLIHVITKLIISIHVITILCVCFMFYILPYCNTIILIIIIINSCYYYIVRLFYVLCFTILYHYYTNHYHYLIHVITILIILIHVITILFVYLFVLCSSIL